MAATKEQKAKERERHRARMKADPAYAAAYRIKQNGYNEAWRRRKGMAPNKYIARKQVVALVQPDFCMLGYRALALIPERYGWEHRLEIAGTALIAIAAGAIPINFEWTDIIKKHNSQLHKGEPVFPTVPLTDELLAVLSERVAA